MDITKMRYFTCAYEEKRISKAAERLFVSQQQISKVIKRIEEELGATLFARTRNGLIPTKEGKAAYESFKLIIEEYDSLNAKMQGRAVQYGTLRVMMDMGMAQVISQEPMLTFKERYPQVELALEEHREHNCKRLVRENEADMGLTISAECDESLHCVRICDIYAEVLVNKRNPLAKKSIITVEELDSEKIVYTNTASYYAFIREYAGIGSTPDVLVAISESKTSLGYVQNNYGVCPAVYTSRRREQKPPEGIVAVPYQGKKQLMLIGYSVKERAQNPLVQLFIDHLNGYFR